MKVLSLWQPWATLIAIGAKRIETRHWQTNYNGPLLIHAAKIKAPEGRAEFNAHFKELREAGYAAFDYLPFGCLVARCDLRDCVPTKYLTGISDLERSVGNYGAGRFGWMLDNVLRIEPCIPLIGRQGLFNFDGVIPYSSTSNPT